MDPTRRKLLEPLWNSLDPEAHGFLPFPPEGDDGEGTGDDADLAQILLYGAQPLGDPTWRSGDWISEQHFVFALRLGRALAALEGQSDQRQRDPEIEAEAQRIYETWDGQFGYVPWVPGGNSHKQDEARALAEERLGR